MTSQSKNNVDWLELFNNSNNKCKGHFIVTDFSVPCGLKINGEYCKQHVDRFRLEKPDECPVCYEKFDENMPLSCGHWVHRICMKNGKKSQCPICRQPLFIEDVLFFMGKESQELKEIEKQFVIILRRLRREFFLLDTSVLQNSLMGNYLMTRLNSFMDILTVIEDDDYVLCFNLFKQHFPSFIENLDSSQRLLNENSMSIIDQWMKNCIANFVEPTNANEQIILFNSIILFVAPPPTLFQRIFSCFRCTN